MTSDVETGATSKHEGKYAALFVCWILGSGCFFAWNSVLMSEDYYVQLFPKYHPTRVLSLAFQPLSLATLFILAYNEAKVNTRRRNIMGFTIFFVCSLLLLLLALATSDKGGIGAYISICVICGVFGVAAAQVQGGMTGDLSFMSSELMQAASGTLTSSLRFVTKAAFENTKDGLRRGAILFLALGTSFELLCILLYARVFPKIPIVKYFRLKAASEGAATVSADLVAGGIQTMTTVEVERLSNKQLLLQNMDYVANIFLTYVLTLSIFPGFLAEDTGSHGLGSWYALVLIAMFNVWDFISRYIPLIEQLRMKSRSGLMLATLSRYLLIPAFYFAAHYGDQGWMIALTSFLGLTNGYLTVCILIAAPKGYKGPEQNALGNFLVLSLKLGIFSGIALDWLWLIGKGW